MSGTTTSPAAPSLIDITVDGRPIKAIAQVSKQGFTYVFDRVTGEPVWPIEERPVEVDTDLAGDVLSPTQPFPTKPPAFEYQGVTIDDLVDFTPEIRALAVEAVQDFRLGPLFTPPMLSEDGGLQGTIQRPHVGGGAGWAGSAVDPETGLLYVPSVNRFSVIKYYTPDPAAGGNLRFTMRGLAAGVQPRMPNGLPLLKPPYSRLTAIDLNRGDHAWMHPNGDGNRYRNHPLLRDLDLPPLGGDGRGGVVVTKTLVVSGLTAGGTDDGPRLVARDKATGEIVGSVDLPGGPIGTPMTYLFEGDAVHRADGGRRRAGAGRVRVTGNGSCSVAFRRLTVPSRSGWRPSSMISGDLFSSRGHMFHGDAVSSRRPRKPGRGGFFRPFLKPSGISRRLAPRSSGSESATGLVALPLPPWVRRPYRTVALPPLRRRCRVTVSFRSVSPSNFSSSSGSPWHTCSRTRRMKWPRSSA